MSMQWIRDHYGVPAKRGAKVIYTGNPDGLPVDGTITGTDGPHLRIRLGDNKHTYCFHPTWKLEYTEATK